MTHTTSTKALEYLLTKGYSVIPVGANKRPTIKWQAYQEEPADEEQLAKWFTNTSHGLGIITGKVSHITVVDIDVKDAEHVTPDMFPETYTVQTPSGGWHLYYEYTDAVHTVARGWDNLPGVDIRNDGGYVVAPPTKGYVVLNDCQLADFPTHLFKDTKSRKKTGGIDLELVSGVASGGRNQAITQMIGLLLKGQPEGEWGTKVWAAVRATNAGYKPPLPMDELERTFRSVAAREKEQREIAIKAAEGAVKSPLEISPEEQVDMKLRTTKNGGLIKDKLNALIALAAHPDWCDAFKYDEFKKEMQYRGERMRDHHVLTAQTWLQGEMDMSGISKSIVADAIEERAHICKYNSAKDWLEGLKWDGVSRVDTWISSVYGVPDDVYHNEVGSNWLRAIAKRIIYPGAKFDHVLVVQGGQGVRKTTSFAVLGRDWHVETTVQADSKDFLMQFDGKAIVEFSEGDTLNRSETKTLKAIITRTIDKYRAPYAKFDEEHPRQCVFCMTTNETEYLKDDTGNRRWWIVRMPRGYVANTEWLEENRDQLFAEAYARIDEEVSDRNIPQHILKAMQEGSRMIDDLEEQVVSWYLSIKDEIRDEGVRPYDFVSYQYRNDPERMPKNIEWRQETKIKSAFRNVLALEYTQKRLEGQRVRKWFPSDETPAFDEENDAF